MPSQIITSVENNFTRGLITESTGLNFPENAATDCDNCTFTIVGDVVRREGIDYEENYKLQTISTSEVAISTYKWNNAGGDGVTQLVVNQVGSTLYFYQTDNATVSNPMSARRLGSTVDISAFIVPGSTFDITSVECQYTDGNGYLFVFHPYCDPFYCIFEEGAITANFISVKIRDFNGINEAGIDYNTRPSTLSDEHKYNLLNQGWAKSNPWQAYSTTTNIFPVTAGTFEAFDIGSSVLPISPGDVINCYLVGYSGYSGTLIQSIQVQTYSGTVVRGPVLAQNINPFPPGVSINWSNWQLEPLSAGNINTWHTAVNNYPSNADVWWNYKDSSGAFNPSTTYQNVSISLGPAPKGHFVLNAFKQAKDVASGISTISEISTLYRPSTGTWFQGRIWYAGVNASQVASGDASHYSWTENIYFSQVVTDPTHFGLCHQTNDPTSQTLFDLLPTDGGVINIQGCGQVYKLFSIQNGLLVFAANGVWFITGSQGIGFAANDYTITKLSSVRSISSTSFVNVNGLPYFWNEEGIYTVAPTQGGQLAVEAITVGTILSFFDKIPLSSKKFARGDYHPIDYVIQWIYKDTDAVDTTDTYRFNKVLSFNTYNKSFYPSSLTLSPSIPAINSIVYVTTPGGSNSPESVFKYVCSITSNNTLTFADEHDSSYKDWSSVTPTDYTSYFITGYKLHGQGQKRFQIPYIYIFSRNDVNTSYKIQGIWNYAISPNSGKWSVAQLVNNWNPNFGMIFRRHRIRGNGIVLQIKVSSSSGMPFDIMGWSIYENLNTGV